MSGPQMSLGKGGIPALCSVHQNNHQSSPVFAGCGSGRDAPDPGVFSTLKLTRAQGRTFKTAGARTWCPQLPPGQAGEAAAAEMGEALAGVWESAGRESSWKSAWHSCLGPVPLLLRFKIR